MTQLEKAIEKELEYISENEMYISDEDMPLARYLARYFVKWGTTQYYRELNLKTK